MSNSAHISSEVLVRRLRNRDEKALSLLYDQYAVAINGFLVRMLKDARVAEEVLQNTFLKAWERIDRYDETKASLYTWLYTIAKNGALDVIRLKSFERQKQTFSLEASDLHKQTVYIATEGIDTTSLLGQLDIQFREVIDCLYLQGMSQSEAAKALEIPLGTVKSRLRTGLKYIRQRLGPDELLLWSLNIGFILLLILLWHLRTS